MDEGSLIFPKFKKFPFKREGSSLLSTMISVRDLVVWLRTSSQPLRLPSRLLPTIPVPSHSKGLPSGPGQTGGQWNNPWKRGRRTWRQGCVSLCSGPPRDRVHDWVRSVSGGVVRRSRKKYIPKKSFKSPYQRDLLNGRRKDDFNQIGWINLVVNVGVGSE